MKHNCNSQHTHNTSEKCTIVLHFVNPFNICLIARQVLMYWVQFISHTTQLLGNSAVQLWKNETEKGKESVSMTVNIVLISLICKKGLPGRWVPGPHSGSFHSGGRQTVLHEACWAGCCPVRWRFRWSHQAGWKNSHSLTLMSLCCSPLLPGIFILNLLNPLKIPPDF